MNITGKQMLAIVIAILGVMMASTAQLNDLIGPIWTKNLVSLAGLTNSVLASVLAVLASQGNLVTDVQAMPGVEKITVNRQANSTLATLTVDEKNQKIEAKPGDAGVIAATASA